MKYIVQETSNVVCFDFGRERRIDRCGWFDSIDAPTRGIYVTFCSGCFIEWQRFIRITCNCFTSERYKHTLLQGGGSVASKTTLDIVICLRPALTSAANWNEPTATPRHATRTPNFTSCSGRMWTRRHLLAPFAGLIGIITEEDERHRRSKGIPFSAEAIFSHAHTTRPESNSNLSTSFRLFSSPF